MNLRVGIVGGGVIGLSTAWELSCRGHEVVLFEKSVIGRKASWAGAGILSPSNSETATQPLDRLLGLGSDLHEDWHHRLLDESGIDNGFWRCGGLYVAKTPGERATLIGQTHYWQDYGIEFEILTPEDSKMIQLSVDKPDAMVVHVAGESQICNPDHLKALELACGRQGVTFHDQVSDLKFEFNDCKPMCVESSAGKFEFDHVCICAGAWSAELAANFGIVLPQIPVRGQMLLFQIRPGILTQIINEGSRYIVPRKDGFVLVGSTTEEVGFDESTTEEKIEELLEFAESWVPDLNRDTLIKSWAGLRPASHDGFPYMGELNEYPGIFVSTGHFKAGLQMSPAAAVIISDQMEERESVMDPSPFHPSRLNLADIS